MRSVGTERSTEGTPSFALRRLPTKCRYDLNGLGQFLSELRRRRVYRVAVGYAVAALAVVEAADLVIPRLGGSESVVTIILVIALVGFPIAVVLSWLYDLTPEGVERTTLPDTGSRSSPYALGIGALVVVVGIGAWLMQGRTFGATTPEPAVSPTEVSLAVLPFEDMSSNGDQEWLGEGFAEEVLSALARVPNLRVVARQSSFSLRDAPLSEIADRLGVTHVLSGSVRTEGPRARIRAQLTEIATQSGTWSRDFRPELTSVLDVQEEMARAVVDALEVELGDIETSIMSASTREPIAHEHYLRGLRLWNRRSEADIISAIDHFEVAVGADPGYAAAWAGLAYAHLVLPEYSPTANLQLARERSADAAGRALAIDPQQPDALTAKGWGQMVHHYDWEGAQALIGQALELDPTNVNALHWQSHVLSWRGHPAEALDLARRAAALDPLSTIMRTNLAFILMEARDYDNALREAEGVVAAEPNYESSLRLVWDINTRAGRFDEAARGLETWFNARGRDAIAARDLAAAFSTTAASFRETGTSGTLPQDLVDRLQPGLYVGGQLFASVGDRAATLETLEQAFRERAGARSLLSIKVNPHFDFLRNDPAFLDLIERVGLGG